MRKITQRNFDGAIGFTLLEVLVSIALTALLLGMALPMLRQVNEPSETNIAPAPWRQILSADLAQAVSPDKSDVVPIRIVRPSGDLTPPRLVIETYCRDGTDARGPAEVTYKLERLPDSSLGLVRYARGWHDSYETRHVVAAPVSQWTLSLAPSDKTQETTSTGPSNIMQSVSSMRGGCFLTVRVDGVNVGKSHSFWIFTLASDGSVSQPKPPLNTEHE